MTLRNHEIEIQLEGAESRFISRAEKTEILSLVSQYDIARADDDLAGFPDDPMDLRVVPEKVVIPGRNLELYFLTPEDSFYGVVYLPRENPNDGKSLYDVSVPEEQSGNFTEPDVCILDARLGSTEIYLNDSDNPEAVAQVLAGKPKVYDEDGGYKILDDEPFQIGRSVSMQSERRLSPRDAGTRRAVILLGSFIDVGDADGFGIRAINIRNRAPDAGPVLSA